MKTVVLHVSGLWPHGPNRTEHLAEVLLVESEV